MAEPIPSPEEFFGFQLGSDREIARWDRIVEYYRLLGQRSDRIRVIEMGPSTEGHPFLLLIVSSAENLRDLERLRAMNLQLSDPRGLSEEEIGRLVPAPGTTPTPSAVSGTVFFMTETSNIAASLELLTTRPDDRTNGGNALARVRALRGVAGVRDIPALAEALEAAETGIRPLELGEPRLSAEHVNLLRACAELLRTIEVQVAAPTIAVRNRHEETQTRALLHQAGVLSKQSWAAQEGLDWELERKGSGVGGQESEVRGQTSEG